ncbi:MAG: hypothetical protein JO295_03260 [Verrucomicrobia bacterium]|nr:hypothetical protein [Verrucomicrobiota bacterium]
MADEAIMGKKAEEKVDPSEVGKTEEVPAEAAGQDEVGGRYRFQNIVICPYCGRRNHIIESSHYYRVYSCWHCGCNFYK